MQFSLIPATKSRSGIFLNKVVQDKNSKLLIAQLHPYLGPLTATLPRSQNVLQVQG